MLEQTLDKLYKTTKNIKIIQSDFLKIKFIKPPPPMFCWEIYEFFKKAILKNTSEKLLLYWLFFIKLG